MNSHIGSSSCHEIQYLYATRGTIFLHKLPVPGTLAAAPYLEDLWNQNLRQVLLLLAIGCQPKQL